MTAFLTNKKAKMLATHCMPDHAHIFVGFKPMILISDFIREIKVESNEFLNDKKWRKKIRLAGGIWYFFLFSCTYRQGCKICVDPGTTSPQKNIQGRISSMAEKIALNKS